MPAFGPPIPPDTVDTGRFDRGRIWSFADPPVDYFESVYGIRADQRGLRHARRATLRLPDCSGSVVSARGLVLTAARCVRSFVPSGIRDTSFLAPTPSEEIRLSGLSVEQVVNVEEVSSRVDSVWSDGGEGGTSAAGLAEQVRQVEAELAQETGPDQRVEVVRENGGRYVAYTYRQFTDIRLAFVADPEVQVFGRLGEPLSYPQHVWDVALLRVYSNGTPIAPDEHFEIGGQETRPGDPVFSVTHPRATRRNETAEQIAFRRDIVLPTLQSQLRTYSSVLGTYLDTTETTARRWATEYEQTQLHRGRVRARMHALHNDYFMSRLRQRDERAPKRMASDTTRRAEWERLTSQISTLLEEKRDVEERFRAFSFLLYPEGTSATVRRALIAREAEAAEGATEGEFEERMRAVPSQPTAVDAGLLAAHLDRLSSSEAYDTLAQGRDPATIVRQSVFGDSASAVKALGPGDIPRADPAYQLVSTFYEDYADFYSTWSDLQAREHKLVGALAPLWEQAAELPTTLPSERAPRLTDGRIQGYPYNGTIAPPFTTFYGLYGRSHAVQPDVDLPVRWTRPSASFDRSTPLTTVASIDVGDDGVGAPLLNSSLQLVGVVVDGNAQSAAGTYLFVPDRMRAVAMDARGILHGLSSIYEADPLVDEMTASSSAP